ncbi:hypothetical protein R1flu_007056 [Riccia fluitans]|uniref:Uncharacterized protein n=1 Tax=Riccia fluitans TaxID=41844 RepID=A0ABD1Z0T6_9MARC
MEPHNLVRVQVGGVDDGVCDSKREPNSSQRSVLMPPPLPPRRPSGDGGVSYNKQNTDRMLQAVLSLRRLEQQLLPCEFFLVAEVVDKGHHKDKEAGVEGEVVDKAHHKDKEAGVEAEVVDKAHHKDKEAGVEAEVVDKVHHKDKEAGVEAEVVDKAHHKDKEAGVEAEVVDKAHHNDKEAGVEAEVVDKGYHKDKEAGVEEGLECPRN